MNAQSNDIPDSIEPQDSQPLPEPEPQSREIDSTMYIQHMVAVTVIALLILWLAVLIDHLKGHA